MSVKWNPVTDDAAWAVRNPLVHTRLKFRPAKKGPSLASNPAAFRARRATGRAKPLVATFVVGLKATRFGGRPIDFRRVQREIMKAFPSGGTIVLQHGWWRRMGERSIQVVIENVGTGLSNAEFKKKVKGLVGKILDKFGQYEVYLDFYRNRRLVGSEVAYWTKGRSA